MQFHFIDLEQLGETLAQSETLAVIESPDGSLKTYVLSHCQQDILIKIANGATSAAVIYPCSSFDHEVGSIHDNARQDLGCSNVCGG